MQKTLDVRGMTCGHCKSSVEVALNELNGVEQVSVDLATGKVDVTFDDSKVTVEDMKNAVEEQGYDVVA